MYTPYDTLNRAQVVTKSWFSSDHGRAPSGRFWREISMALRLSGQQFRELMGPNGHQHELLGGSGTRVSNSKWFRLAITGEGLVTNFTNDLHLALV